MTTPLPMLFAELAGWTALGAVVLAGIFGAVVVVDLVRRVAAVSGD